MKRLCLTLFASFAATQAYGVQVIIDGGFEDGVSTSPGDGLPAITAATRGNGVPSVVNTAAPLGGAWSGDPTQVVTASSAGGGFTGMGNQWNVTPGPVANDIIFGGPILPRTGSNMLQFVGTESSDALYTAAATPLPPLNVGSDLWQIIDVSTFSGNIAAGTATIEASGWFASHDGGGDDQFLVEVRFYDGDNGGPGTPAQFATNPVGYDSNSFQIASIGSTATPATAWTQITTGVIAVPSATDMIVVRIGAIENNAAGGTKGGEFQANFADDISVNFEPGGPIIPEPARAALLLIGALSMVTRRRRK